jgi:RNA polymerase sigma-70 factor (ECF subfamily)
VTDSSRPDDAERRPAPEGAEGQPAAAQGRGEGRKGKEEGKDVRALATLATIPAVEQEGDTPDHELVRQARQGDHAAFETLVRRYSERAYRAAYRVVRDPSQSEEIVQEALIKAYRGLRRFESRSSFYTWLYRIVVNLALDRRRREKRVPTMDWDDTVAKDIDPRASVPLTADPELSSRRGEVRRLVAEGIKGLPDGQREVLLLREVEGLSYEEIAQSMKISKGTVMSRLHYARKKMLVFLKQAGVEPEDAQ